MFGLFSKIIGNPNERTVKKLQPVVDEINALEDEYVAMSDAELLQVTTSFRTRLTEDEETLEDLLPEAFAAVREAARRTLKMRHFDVQLVGGIVLHQGKISEMRTGEGKTLVATLAAYLNGLTGEGLHVVTVNDYLARRDASWMGSVYHALGMSVGCIQHETAFKYSPNDAPPNPDEQQNSNQVATDAKTDPDAEAKDTAFADMVGANLIRVDKKTAYDCDIVYATNNELGFDLLRDNMVNDPSSMVQRSLSYAIVDEVDNILIDEARTPLIISGPAEDKGREYRQYAKLATQLESEVDYEIDEKRRSIGLTEEGIEMVEKTLGLTNLYDPENAAQSHLLENAIRAEAIFKKDTDYVVKDGEIVLIDEFTGRLMTGRRLSDGLHQAIEAKEGLFVHRESRTYATITLQNFFRMYEKLSGMTGTALTEAEEFYKIYGLEVVSVPTNREDVREDLPDQIFMTEKAKWQAVVDRVAELHKQKVPVLVGTTSVEKSEILMEMLRKKHLPINVLNARNNEREAEIISQAGAQSAITVSTNMAGRGTDIILGGNPANYKHKDAWQKNHNAVIESGGLYVLGTERHEARRIDNQLRGRAGRQGDPGQTQFFISTEDSLVRRFGGDRIRGVMSAFQWEDNTPIENRVISRSIESAQIKVEAYNFEIRKHLVDYDNVINNQRRVIYELRGKIRDDEDIRTRAMEYAEAELREICASTLPGAIETWDLDALRRQVIRIFPSFVEVADSAERLEWDTSDVVAALADHANMLYDKREREFGGADVMARLIRLILLRTVDESWVEHLTVMENMRQGIGLQAVGQRDPLVQYQHQGFAMFEDLVSAIQHQSSRLIFNSAPAPKLQQQPLTTKKLNYLSPTANNGNRSSATGPAAAKQKVGRNTPCPCGSGKKYKKCHGAT